MHYFDTSFLAPIILNEPTSSAVERVIAALPAGRLTVSHWTRVEFSSLVARQVRMGSLRPQSAKDADAEFEAMIAETFVVLLPSTDDFNLAKTYLGNFGSGLRAGDALHLAIAKNNKAELVLSLDKALLKAGKALGLPVSAGI